MKLQRLIDGTRFFARLIRRNAHYFKYDPSPAKLVNFLRVQYEYHRALPVVKSLPYSIFLDPVNICPLRCPLCGTGNREATRKQQKLSLDDFYRFVQPLQKTLYEIKFYNYGEPLLNPHLPVMIEYAKRNGIQTQVNTNLQIFAPEQAAALIDAGLTRLVVSFDGITQESYERYRKGGSLQTLMHNLDILNEAKHISGKNNPEIVLQYLVNRYNEHELEKAGNYARTIGARLFPTGIMIDITNKDQRETWLPESPQWNLYNMDNLTKKKTVPDKRCGFLWNDPVINVDGGVAPCCHLFHASMDYGNLRQHSFAEIWNSPSFVEARRIFAGRSVEHCHTPCVRCVDDRAFTDTRYDLVNEGRTNNLR